MERDHRRPRRGGGSRDADLGRERPHRRDGDPPSRARRARRPVRGRVPLAERQRRDDRRLVDRGVGDGRRPDRDHEHPRRRDRARGGRRLDREAPPGRRRCLAAAGGGRDVGRLPERHQRRPRHGRGGGAGARVREHRPGRGGLGRRWHRDELLRVQGRLGDGIADARLRRRAARRRRVRADELRRASRAHDRRRADGRGARGRRPDRRALLGAPGRRLRHRGGRHRRAAAAGPVRRPRPPGDARPGADGNRGLPLLGGPVRRVLGREPRGVQPGRRHAVRAGIRLVRRPSVRAVGPPRSVLRGGRPGDRGGRAELPRRERGDGRLPRASFARPAARPRGRAPSATGARGPDRTRLPVSTSRGIG